jgi:hypothetical protein
MGRGVDPYLEELMKKRESMVSNLDTLKGQLDLSKADKKKRLSRNGKGKEADNRAAYTAGDTAENL